MEQPEQPQLPPLIIDGPPWEKKHEIGFFVAFVETIKSFLLHPAKTFSVMRRVSGIADALVYTLAIQVFTFLWTFAMGGADPSMLLPQNPELLDLLQLPDNISQIMILIYPLSVILLQFISAYGFHIAMSWRNQQLYDFSLVFRIFAYATGTAAILLIIPLVGGLVSLMISIYLVFVALRTIYGLNLISFLTTSLLAIVISIGLYIISALGISIAVLFISLLI